MNGSVLPTLAVEPSSVVWLATLLATEQSCGLYVWHVELDRERGARQQQCDSNDDDVAMRFISPA